jgi:hypothetical protein
MRIHCKNEQGQVVGALNLVVDITKAHRASRAYATTLAVIDIAVTALTAIRWENATFD